jgi:hypothetical protein
MGYTIIQWHIHQQNMVTHHGIMGYNRIKF